MKPSQISNTAAFIAVKFYGLTRRKKWRALFDDEVVAFYEKVVQALPFPVRSYHRMLKNRWARRFFIYWEELLLPGDLMHILMRKWYLQKMITEKRRQGYHQLLVIGAGFDHLACLQSQKGMTALEYDAPRMVAVKRNFIKNNGYANAHLSICDAYFSRDSLGQILSNQSRIDPQKKTIVVAEGFFDYLDQPTAAAMIQQAADFFEGPLTLYSTLFSLQELPGFRSLVYKTSIKLAGEKLKLGMNRAQFCHLLQQHGFTIAACKSYRDMQKEVLQPRNITMPVLPGFYLIDAQYRG